MKSAMLITVISLALSAAQCGQSEPGTEAGPDISSGAGGGYADSHYREGLLFARSGKNAEARASFDRAIFISPGFGGARLRRGLLDLAEKKYAGARADLAKAVELLVGNARQSMINGFAMFHGGNYTDAIDAWKVAGTSLRELDESCIAIAHAGLGDRKWSDQMRQPALAAGLAALSYCRGIAFLNIGRSRDADRNLQRAIELKDDFHEAYVYRAKIMYETGRSGDAIRDLTMLLRMRPGNPTAHFNRGVAYYQRKMYREALEDFNFVVKSNPRDADAFFNRAMAHSKLGNGEETLLDIKQAIKLNPRKSEFYNKSETPCPGRGIGF
jgi:tetratricopeptide (TPR) repeat protein